MPKRAIRVEVIVCSRGQNPYQKEFLRWYKLAAELKPFVAIVSPSDINIPTLYVMGSEDYMFLSSIENSRSTRIAQLSVAPHSGVVNVDQPDAFNSRSISFIKINR